jgi:hypothetical protein
VRAVIVIVIMRMSVAERMRMASVVALVMRMRMRVRPASIAMVMNMLVGMDRPVVRGHARLGCFEDHFGLTASTNAAHPAVLHFFGLRPAARGRDSTPS